MSLLDDIRALADAHGPAALAAAHARLQGDVRRKRKADAGTTSKLNETIAIANQIWATQKADGVSLQERVATMEQTLRLAWPFRPGYKPRCDRCGDYGLEMSRCDGDDRPTCGRTKIHAAHEYGRPCFCPAGKQHQPKRVSAEDFTQAGAVKRKPTRFGR